MLNVDGGSSPVRPDEHARLRPVWRFTWVAVIALVVFLLATLVLRGVDRARDTAAPPSLDQSAEPNRPPK